MTTRDLSRRITLHRRRGTAALERYGTAHADLRQARTFGDEDRARVAAAAVEEARREYVRAVGSAKVLESIVEERRVRREERVS